MPAVAITPRLLTKAQAAAYVGLTQPGFDRWRKEGRMPNPLPGTVRYDRVDIDAAIEDLKKFGKFTAPASAPPPPPQEEDDPLAAFLAKKGPKPWLK